jgi:hypothetical protein
MNRPPSRGKPWTATDRTGGPLDELPDQLRSRLPREMPAAGSARRCLPDNQKHAS